MTSRSILLDRFGIVVAVVALVAAPRPAHGQAKRAYDFAAPPLEIYDRLAEAKIGPVTPLSTEERELLASIWQQTSKGGAERIGDDLLLEALLFASGIESGDAR